MRGKVCVNNFCKMFMGITPAYAGKRTTFKEARSNPQDHPRLCGEKFLHVFVVFDFRGSPPPMRGKVLNLSVADFPFGITPAYAGKSRKASSRDSVMRDHPRLCGEKFNFRKVRFLYEGSPPPMRGKAFIDRIQIFKARITPAYAGKSVPLHGSDFQNTDHPRLCGEKTRTGTRNLIAAGSPPPMRGKGS